jgi:hypothetical protein
MDTVGFEQILKFGQKIVKQVTECVRLVHRKRENFQSPPDKVMYLT